MSEIDLSRRASDEPARRATDIAIDPGNPARFRTGRKNGHTVYVQQGPFPSDDDVFVGSFVSPTAAQNLVRWANAGIEASIRSTHSRLHGE